MLPRLSAPSKDLPHVCTRKHDHSFRFGITMSGTNDNCVAINVHTGAEFLPLNLVRSVHSRSSEKRVYTEALPLSPPPLVVSSFGAPMTMVSPSMATLLPKGQNHPHHHWPSPWYVPSNLHFRNGRTTIVSLPMIAVKNYLFRPVTTVTI